MRTLFKWWWGRHPINNIIRKKSILVYINSNGTAFNLHDNALVILRQFILHIRPIRPLALRLLLACWLQHLSSNFLARFSLGLGNHFASLGAMFFNNSFGESG